MLSQELSTSRLICSISCHSDKRCQKRLKAPGFPKVQFPLAGRAQWLESLLCALFISWWIRKLTSCYRSPQDLPLVADLSLAAKSYVQRTPYPLKKELLAGDQVFSHFWTVSALRTSVPLYFFPQWISDWGILSGKVRSDFWEQSPGTPDLPVSVSLE